MAPESARRTLAQRFKHDLSLAYFKLIDVLHWPLVRKGQQDPYHQVIGPFLELGRAMAAPVVLEIGSRNVSGVTRRDWFEHCSEYVGFDVLEGEGVDVVGDAHNLSKYFPEAKFDLVYTVSVFEHLMFPWKVVLEINKVMRTGGYVFVTTHPAWPEHELPWDFWRFQTAAFHGLFNALTGFELVTVAEGLPCKPYSLVDDRLTRPLCFYTLNQGIAVIARKTGDYRKDLLKWDIDIKDVNETTYPAPNGDSDREFTGGDISRSDRKRDL